MKTIYFILLFICLCACAPLNVEDDDDDTRPDDRGGDPTEEELPDDVLEGLSLIEILRNCKPDVDVPSSVIDLTLEVFDISDRYPPGLIRKCLRKKLEDAQDRICKAKITLERKRDNARSQEARARAENQLVQLEQIQFNFNQRLYDMALKIDDESSTEGKSGLSRIIAEWKDSESSAFQGIFDVASYSECNTDSSYDDD